MSLLHLRFTATPMRVLQSVLFVTSFALGAAAGCGDAGDASTTAPVGTVGLAQERAAARSFLQAPVPLRLRTGHSATLLTDGRVLLVGGNNSGGGVESSTEIYNPTLGAASPAKPLAQARWAHTATLLPDGRVLVTGGNTSSGVWPDTGTPTDSTEIFDPATEAFSSGPTLSAVRAKHTASRLPSNRVLLAGGGDPSAELFDPTSDALVPTGAMVGLVAGHAAALLADGRVLLVGSQASMGNTPASEIFDPAANGGVGAFVSAPAPTQSPAALSPWQHSLTTLRSGRALLVGGCPCASVGGPTFSSSVAELFDPLANGGAGAWSQTGSTVRDRLGHTATLLPSGQVLLAGSWDTAISTEQSTAELYDPQSGTFSEITEPMAAAHAGHTATLLATGDVMLFGGGQAAVNLYVGWGSPSPGAFALTGSMPQGRWDGHTATRLTSGEVVVVGGRIDALGNATATAELYQPPAGTFAATGALGQARTDHTATLLPDARVLVAGGTDGSTALQTAELYDRSGNGGQGAFVASSQSLGAARLSHSATVLSDGRVLLAGGGYPVSPLDSAELYDPQADTFTPVAAAMATALTGHAAALLPTGDVLLVGEGVAQLFDPSSETFSLTGAPGADYATPWLGVLPSGKALLSGSYTLAAEIYDPATGTFAFTGPAGDSIVGQRNVMLPSGQVLRTGGQGPGIEPAVKHDVELFDPLGGLGQGAFHLGSDLVSLRTGHSATLLTSGQVLVTGGVSCLAICPPTPFASAELWTPTVGNPAWRPVLTGVPTVVHPGDVVALMGTGLRGPEGSSGAASASPSNHPVAVWQPEGRDASVVGRVTGWTDTTAEWHVPATALYGRGWLLVVVSGIPSTAVAVEIQAADAGVGCRFGPECATGFCADGVCCDAPCTGACQGCTAERKGQGDDGVCGPVPPELDPADACGLSQGAPCTVDAACDSELCVDGVCCDAPCTGQCEACDVEDSEGVCIPVLGPPHGTRPACDATPPADPCETGRCDGTSRSACTGTIGPCSPYACTPTGCLESCAVSSDCAVGYHCDPAGSCVPGLCEGAVATTPDGQVVDCTPYKCQPDGSCRVNCGDVNDCADPYACDFQGRCVARPPPDVAPGSCGCRVVGAPPHTPSGGAGLTLLLGLLTLPGLRRCASRARQHAEEAGPRGRSQKSSWARLGLGFGLLLILGVGPALAQPAGQSGPAPSAAPAEGGPGSLPAGSSDASSAEAARKDKAREHFARGLALTKDSAWAAALAEFLASRGLHPTRVATSNAAFCYRKLLRYDEALAMYETLLRDFGDIPHNEKVEVQGLVSELRPLVGTIEVDAAEPGAAVVVDGALRGTYPLSAPLRMSAGSHIIRVHKEGYEPFETRVDLAGGHMARVEARLSPLRESGRLSVTETAGKTLEVMVDNVVVGKTPWEGMLSLGDHTVRLRGEGNIGTQPSSAPVKLRQTTSLSLKAEVLDATLRVEPTPANATVVIDSVTVGRGVWEGPLRVGPHKVEVAAEGFLPTTKQVTLGAGENGVQAVELVRDEDAEMWRIPPKIALELSGAPAVVPSYFGDVVGACAGGCSQSVGIGVQAQLHAGVEFSNGFGVGIMAGFFTASQEINGRTTRVTPVGLTPREGSATDSLRVRGPFVGAAGWYTLGDQYPVLFRLSAGPLFAWVRDDRTGSFRLDNGGAYQAGPVSIEPYATYLHIDPEIRVGLRVLDHLVLSAGVQGMIMVALTRAQWDPTKEIDAAIDGIGAFSNEGLTGPAFLVLNPGIAARYEL